MANRGQTIVQKENQPKNIERLAAQKEMYSQAKRLFFVQFLLTVIITISLAFIGIALTRLASRIDWNWIRSVYGLTIAIADVLILSPWINRLRHRAAAVQELFDCDVLDLEWNKVLVGEKPTPEDIKNYADRHLLRVKHYEKLQDWYSPRIAEVDGPVARVICQRSNVSYDASIRNDFIFLLGGTSISVLVVTFGVSLALNLSSRSLIALSLFPILPVLTFSAKLIIEHKSSLRNLKSLSSDISTVWTQALEASREISEATIRRIQDKIYLNRRSSPLIPERFYNWRRTKLEQLMHYGVDELVKEYKSNT